MEEHYLKLVGKRIVAIVHDRNGEYYGLKFDDGSTVWILRDPEGNGPGFLEIE